MANYCDFQCVVTLKKENALSFIKAMSDFDNENYIPGTNLNDVPEDLDFMDNKEVIEFYNNEYYPDDEEVSFTLYGQTRWSCESSWQPLNEGCKLLEMFKVWGVSEFVGISIEMGAGFTEVFKYKPEKHTLVIKCQDLDSI